MKKYSLLLSVFVLIGASLSACKKNNVPEDDEPVVTTAYDLIAAPNGKAWTIKTLEAPITTGFGQIIVDLTTFSYEGLNFACIKDNVFTFYIDSTIIMSDGAKVCDPNQTGDVHGKWRLNSRMDSLYIDKIESVLTSRPLPISSLSYTLLVSNFKYVLNDTVFIPFQGQSIAIKEVDIKLALQSQ